MLQTKFILSLLLIITQICGASQNGAFRVKFYSSESLRHINLFHDKKGFYVVKDGETIDIANYNIDYELRSVSDEQLEWFLRNGYVHLKQIDNNEYILKAYINGHGGNPWLIVGISIIMGEYFKREVKLVGKWLQNIRKEGSEELKHKSEYTKTVKDRVCQMYDAVLFDGAVVSLLNKARANRDNEAELEKIQMITQTMETHKQEIRDDVVLQITERYLKMKDAEEQMYIHSIPDITPPNYNSQEHDRIAEAARVENAAYKEKWANGPFDNPKLNQVHSDNEKGCITS